MSTSNHMPHLKSCGDSSESMKYDLCVLKQLFEVEVQLIAVEDVIFIEVVFINYK